MVADLVIRIIHSKTYIISTILFPALLVVSYALMSFLLYYERLKGIWSSGYTFNFWVLCSCYLIVYIWSRSIYMEKSVLTEFFQYTLYIMQLAIVILQIILHCFNAKSRSRFDDNKFLFLNKKFRTGRLSSKHKAQKSEENIKLTSKSKDETSLKTCPEIYASFLSRISFWWVNKLVLYGSKCPLTKLDLWQLADKDSSLKLCSLFDKHWYHYIDKFEQKVQKTLCVHNRLPTNKSTRMHKNPEIGIYKTSTSQKLLRGAKAFDENSPKPQFHSEDESIKLNPSLTFVLFCCFKSIICQSILYKLVSDLLIFLSPQILKYLISFVNSKSQSLWIGVFYAITMLAAVILQTIILNQYFQIVFAIGMRIKTILICAVYKKALRLSNSARKTSTVGEIVNLMSVDTQKVSEVCSYVSLLWSGPFQIGICMIFLWNILGPSVLSGLLVMVLLIPLNAVMANKITQLQASQMKLKDERIKIMNEVLNGIKVIKLYAWELSFEDKILKIRNKEVDILKKIAFLLAYFSFIWCCAPFLVSCATFATYVLSNPEHILDAEKAFVSLALFNLLHFPLSMFPIIITFTIEARVSLKRLCRFLLQDEIEPNCVIRETLNTNDTNNDVIIVKNSNFAWDFPKGSQIEDTPELTTEAHKVGKVTKGNGDTIFQLNDSAISLNNKYNNYNSPVLKNLNFTVEKGQLVAIVGAVGSGKSSLLSALLGEMKIVNSTNFQREIKENISFATISHPMVKIRGSVAYTSQQPWIRNANLRDNVTFEAPFPFDSLAYIQALQTCDLIRDRDYLLPNGDDTEIGEKGLMNNSNGDLNNFGKATQTAANGEKANTDDSSLRTSTTLLIKNTGQVTSQTETLRDSLLSLELGIPGIESSGLLSEDLEKEKSDGHNTPDMVRKRLGSKEKIFEEVKRENGGGWMTTEISETGRVKISLYLTYFKALKYHIFALAILLFGVYYALSVAANFWLSDWSDDKPIMINGTAYQNIPLRNKRLGVYALYGFLQGITIMASIVIVALSMVAASRYLHQKLLRNILHSPLSFFDSTPLGRIVNRFSKDLNTIDNSLPPTIRSWLTNFYAVLTTLLVICWSTPMFLISVVPLAIIYFFILKFYIPTSRQLKRLESISTSPIYSHFQETLLGASTIRAFGVMDKFITESYRLVDQNQMCYYPSLVSNRWLAVRLEFIGSFIVFFAALTIALNRDNIKPGQAGLALSYALSVTQALNLLVRMTCDLETNIVAVERIAEYSDTPTEALWIIPDHKPPADWPSRGSIEFSHYTMRYHSAAMIASALPPALNDISFQVQAESKVGIVGRTGAGKSSITAALFRIVEADDSSTNFMENEIYKVSKTPKISKIYVDGIDISKLGLHDIRSRITIIPQDSILFSGTLRFNLDPFNEKTDIEVWESLRNAHLHSFVSNLPLGIDHEIAEYGENLSLGQRQLVCLARALLRKSKILVLDEATAAVDLETDELIQKTIVDKFAHCTVLTIAHRLNTIIDYDKILVLDHGRNVEFDIPSNLLQNKRGQFYGMCLEAGLTN
ncbi:multidrug resistance-associated protein 1-like isoform X3 [Gordionus sp. m RMFG-2023]|uniref:multidrug resistance-associated protein 1-like isoform X3 n=1 Tax=Gordionus sp. m RMFG-2023 TaxID=3053472 RepID=UPI0031FC67F2